MCQITIADDGPGIAPEVREKLFTPFFTTKARGTGLGLSTARRLVEAHGGTLAIECPPARGHVGDAPTSGPASLDPSAAGRIAS